MLESLRAVLAFLVLALFVTPLSAQQLVQTVLVPITIAQSSFKIKLTPTQPGDFLVMYGFMGNNPPHISDTQGNTWEYANLDDTTEFRYVEASKGGTESITVAFPDPQYYVAVIAEFSGSWKLANVVASRDFTIGINGQAVNSGQSLKYNDNTTTPSSFPLTTTEPNELVIGYGNSGPLTGMTGFTPGPGWTAVGFIDNRSMQYQIVPLPKTLVSIFIQKFLPEGIYATEGIVAFRMSQP
jgi:hypothetical protein